MKLLIAAALLVAPAFADCCSYERVRAEVRRGQAEATRQARHYRAELRREAARARVEARRAMRDAHRNRYHDRRWYF
jgi:hypothetical protein